jgi:hypothetical protein
MSLMSPDRQVQLADGVVDPASGTVLADQPQRGFQG